MKLRGFRIELGEIEAALAAPRRRGAGARWSRARTSPGDKRLVAYVVPAAGLSVDRCGAARRISRQSLPDYMVPSAFVSLDALPLTPNGKLDRKALPAPDLPRARPAASATPQEHCLCRALRRGARPRDVGVDDNFFALGGDSIVAIQLVTRARAAGLVFTPRDVFQYKTVEKLAAVVRPFHRGEPVADVGIGPLQLVPIMHWLREQRGPIEIQSDNATRDSSRSRKHRTEGGRPSRARPS